MIVAYEIREQNIDDIIIDSDMVHTTIVIITTASLKVVMAQAILFVKEIELLK